MKNVQKRQSVIEKLQARNNGANLKHINEGVELGMGSKNLMRLEKTSDKDKQTFINDYKIRKQDFETKSNS